MPVQNISAQKYAPTAQRRPQVISRKEASGDRHFATFSQYLRTAKLQFNERWSASDLHETVNLTDFQLFRTLGIGSFGRVMLAMFRDTDQFYAIKIQDKEDIVKHNYVHHTFQELRILDAVRFPFLVHLNYFFKSNCYLFAVLPFIPGGEMFSLLAKEKKLTESGAKFYAAQVLLAIEYLHSNGVVYRDLKPENILIDAEGFLKLVDFGFCKKINDSRAWTLCGTPEYLAPEVILSLGYSYSVDFWSLGILIYEMVAGRPPFYSKDQMKLFELIVNGKYRVPVDFSKHLQDLIQHLLQVDRDKRFGVMREGIKDIKRHEWFKTVEWTAIFTRASRAPFIPKPFTSPKDVVNFDTFDEQALRECPKEEYPRTFQHIRIEEKK